MTNDFNRLSITFLVYSKTELGVSKTIYKTLKISPKIKMVGHDPKKN